jgi:N-dimethylarginine dimethylaminohydrolase
MTTDLGPQTMVGALELIAVKTPAAALEHSPQDEWRGLGWHSEIDTEQAATDHAAFVSVLAATGAEVISVPADERTGLDSLYAHDSSLVTPAGVVPLVSGKPQRTREGAAIVDALSALGVPVLEGFVDPAATADGGDFTWLDPSTLLAGHSFRTNAAGIGEVSRIVAPQGVSVVSMDLPYWHGPAEVLHLMSFISMLDHDLAVIYAEMLPIRLSELLCDRGIACVEVPPEEFASQGCNVLALEPRRVLMLAGNPVTQRRLEAAGCEVQTYDGTEISLKGDGGPTCLTRPLKRSA